MWNKVAVIGLGLIGGSFALALKKSKKVKHIVGMARSVETQQKALSLGIVDEITSDFKTACKNVDVIMLAVPVLSTESVLKAIYPHLEAHTLITDGGSTKGNVVAAAQSALKEKRAQFVPAHPIAGTEHSGPEAAFDSLYENKPVILTPLPQNASESTETITQLWQTTGAQVSRLPYDEHDKIFAATSHLPHLLAFTLVNTLNAEPNSNNIFENAASGFDSVTRIASSDATMWRDIALANKNELNKLLGAYINNLSTLRDQISQGEADKLHTTFAQAKYIRDSKIIKKTS